MTTTRTRPRRTRSEKQMCMSDLVSAFDCRQEYDTHCNEDDLWEALDYLDNLTKKVQRLREKWTRELKGDD